MLSESPLKEYEINDELYQHFILGAYIDPIVCDRLLETFQKLHEEKKTSYRKTPKNYYVANLLDHFPKEQSKRYLQELSQAFILYQQKFEWSRFNHLGQYGIVPSINVQYFEPHHNYSMWHSERVGKFVNRNFFWITYLNNVTDDGETVFFYQDLKIQPRKGLTIIAPTEWTHTHKGIASSQEKYIVTGWTEHKMHYQDPLIYAEDIIKNNNKTDTNYA